MLAAIGFSLKILMIFGGGVLLTLSLSALAIYYFLSFAFLNDIPFGKMFHAGSYKEISRKRIIGTIGLGFALSCISIGTLFFLQFWPGGTINIGLGLFLLAIAVIVALNRYSETRSVFYKKIFLRAFVFGGIGIIALFTPAMKLFELFHRNNPAYIEATRKYWADPGNDSLWKDVQKLRESDKK